MNLKIISADWHRNGVGGVGFHAILFDDAEQGRMFAALFDDPGFCAVVQVPKLNEGNCAFGSNSWHGDRYEAELRPLLKVFLKQNGSNRIGPFSMPVTR